MRGASLAVYGTLGLVLILHFAAGDVEKCVLTTRRCKNFGQFNNAQFRDAYGEDILGAGDVFRKCFVSK